MDLITPNFGLIFWQTITLLAVLLILGKFAWKPILNTIQEREEYVEAALKAAKDAKELAAQVHTDKEALLKTVQKEREKILEQAMAAKREIMAEAKVEADKASQKAIELTKVLLEKEKEEAIAALKNEVATLSVEIAEKLLQHELQQTATQENLIQRLIKKAHWN